MTKRVWDLALAICTVRLVNGQLLDLFGSSRPAPCQEFSALCRVLNIITIHSQTSAHRFDLRPPPCHF